MQLDSEQSTSSLPPRPWFLNPAVMFYASWLGVWFLYSLGLSNILIFPFDSVMRLEIPLLGSFLPVFLLTFFLPKRLYVSPVILPPDQVRPVLEMRMRFWFRVWVVLTLIEIAYSGGIPILWTIFHSSKTYFDFGIPTLHGFLNGLIIAITVTRFAIGVTVNEPRNLMAAVYLGIWSLLLETRQELIVLLLEIGILFFLYRTLKPKRIAALLSMALLVIIVFGISGDLRSGGDNFRQLASPTERFPSWFPSGFLWVYMYATTPLNNLVNTYISTPPLNDPTLPNTLSSLLPSFVRKAVAGSSGSVQGDLLSDAFNVSTAYVSVVEDAGIWGIIGFSSFIALVTGLFWRKRGFRNDLIYAVLAQCLIVTVFYDHFLYLPVVSQIIWIYFFFRQTGGNLAQPQPSFEAVATPHDGETAQVDSVFV